MLVLSLGLVIISLWLGILFFSKKTLGTVVRLPALIICAVTLLAGTCLLLIVLDGHRINRSAKGYINILIKDRNIGDIIYSTATQSNQKQEIQNAISGIPKGVYKIELQDVFFTYWEYNIYFDNRQSYRIVIEVPKSFMSFFQKIEHRLHTIEKLEDNETGSGTYKNGGSA